MWTRVVNALEMLRRSSDRRNEHIRGYPRHEKGNVDDAAGYIV